MTAERLKKKTMQQQACLWPFNIGSKVKAFAMVTRPVGGRAWADWVLPILIPLPLPQNHPEEGPRSVLLGDTFAKYDHLMGARLQLDFVAVQGFEYGRDLL